MANIVENSRKNDKIIEEGLEPFYEKETVITSNGICKKITMSICPQCGNQISRYTDKYRCRFCKIEIKWPSKNKKEGA